MAYSYNEVVATGTPQLITAPPYIDQTHIKVSVNGVDTTSFVWVNASTVQVTALAGAKVRVRRESSPNTRVVDYIDGQSLTEVILDNDSKQAFYLAQEQLDATAEAVGAIGSLPAALAAMGVVKTDAEAARDAALAAKAVAENLAFTVGATPASSVAPPVAAGAGATGSSNSYSRGDHQHPAQPTANVPGGVRGGIPYQSAADSTAVLAPGASGQLLKTNGPGADPSWADAPNSGFSNVQVFKASGTFTVPAGITKVKVTVVGGGSGGGNGSGPQCGSYYTPGIGGCGGGAAVRVITGLVPGASVAVTVGAGGAAGSSGGTSSFGAYCSATGGALGAGGIGTGGDFNVAGNCGGSNVFGNGSGYSRSGSGGGGALLGGGGIYNGGNGAANTGGGGGGGYLNGAGGLGGSGIVIVEF